MNTFTKILKWLALIIGALLIFIFAAYLIISDRVENRINKTYEVSLQPIGYSSDSITMALGKHLSIIKGCTDCHGSNFQGGFVINDAPVGVVYAPNLTKGKGSKTLNYTDKDWVRSIKHGVSPEGKALWIMPSYEYDVLSEEDLTALISYVKNQEPVDSEPVQNALGPIGKVLLNFDQIEMLAAEKINHKPKNLIKKVAIEESAEYGKYLITSCIGCHRSNLEGGGPVAPGFPPVPNITPIGRLANYNEDTFTKFLRTGISENGRQVDSKDMPWTMTKEFTDLEIRAIYLYLKTLPADEQLVKR